MRRAKKLGKEYREKKHVLELYREYKQTLTERNAASDILTDEKDDEELIRMANDEIRELDQKLKQWEEDIYIELLPKERSNERHRHRRNPRRSRRGRGRPLRRRPAANVLPATPNTKNGR